MRSGVKTGEFKKMSPKIVAIGGGTGLSTILRGLKHYTDDITAIVTVADDGGGSGILRKELGMPPPGDIRNCLNALANIEPTLEKVIDYRFETGSLQGQNFGNLFLAALTGMYGSFTEAVLRMSELLAITGRVLVVTDEDIQIEAQFENGGTVLGESHISEYKKKSNCKIKRINIKPEHPKAFSACIEALENADMIVIGPGSLYTSIVPNLLVDGISEAIAMSDAVKLYVCNIMTQDGETEGCTVSDHIEALFSHAGRRIFDYCLCNSRKISEPVALKYSMEGAVPIDIDEEKISKLGVELIWLIFQRRREIWPDMIPMSLQLP